MNYIEDLQSVIEKLHGTRAKHVETVPVTETFEGETIWTGEVEVFDLANHPDAKRVFAWAYDYEDPDKPTQHALILGVIGVGLSMLGVVGTWNEGPEFGPKWYPLALVAM